MVYSIFSVGSIFMEKFTEQNGLFLRFLEKMKKKNFAAKNLCDKVSKIKIWDDSFVGFSAGFVMVYYLFSVDAVFMEKSAK